jgi:benzoyl-CoA reductase/2-hydroxyglutaryl-CoA dehydratase subunit BcrC/BadD/HgdB
MTEKYELSDAKEDIEALTKSLIRCCNSYTAMHTVPSYVVVGSFVSAINNIMMSNSETFEGYAARAAMVIDLLCNSLVQSGEQFEEIKRTGENISVS